LRHYKSFFVILNWMLAKLSFAFLLCAAALLPAQAQSNCNDPQATNYNPAATGNDGSCQYPVTTTALPLKTKLADGVAESSGLVYTNGKLWTFNDSGNPPVLFRIDSASGQVAQQVRITNFDNVDWEDITADAQYVYVGDFGNNSGSRRDLRVLRVPKTSLGAAATTATAEAIEFSYPDQTDFTPRNNRHDFDCEAFFYANDSLHLFTKNWVDLQTRYYTIPAAPGTYVAHLKATFNVNGLVTGAALNATGSVAGLLGYNAQTAESFIWLLSGFKGGNYLQGYRRRIELPSAVLIGQVEGLCFVDRYRVFISNERLSNFLVTVPQQLYSLPLSRWLAPTVLATKPKTLVTGFTALPNPAHHTLHIARTTSSTDAASVQLLDLQGRTALTTSLPAGRRAQDLDLSAIAAGNYVLKIQTPQGTFSKKITVH
jgi:hypothetical protein